VTEIPSDSSAAVAIAAIENSPIEYWRTCCRYLPDAEFHDEPDLTWFVTGIASAPWFNQVLRTRLAPGGHGRKVDEMLALFRRRGLPMLWSVGPSDRPTDLGSLLESRGLAAYGVLLGMAIELGAPLEGAAPTPELTIERVSDAAGLEAWVRAYVGGFEMAEAPGRALADRYGRIGVGDDSPFRHYVGSLDGRPVASSTLFLGERAAAVWHVATVPNARGRSIGTAMTLAPLAEARSLGYPLGVLFAAPMGVGVYRRLGFREYREMTQYLWSPADGNS